MKQALILLLAMSAGAVSFAAADEPPVAAQPVVEMKGAITQVHIAMGQGMPWLEVKGPKETVKVWLGSMRYLIAENFNPKAGQEVDVKGYQMKDGLVAIQVTLTAEKKTLKLRDAKGWPLWRGGPGHMGMGSGAGKQ